MDYESSGFNNGNWIGDNIITKFKLANLMECMNHKVCVYTKITNGHPSKHNMTLHCSKRHV